MQSGNKTLISNSNYDDYVKKGFKPYQASYHYFNAAESVAIAVLVNALPINQEKREEGIPEAFVKSFVCLFGEEQRPHLDHIYQYLCYGYDGNTIEILDFLTLLINELWKAKHDIKLSIAQIAAYKAEYTTLPNAFPQMSQQLQRRIVVFQSKQDKDVYGAEYGEQDEIVLVLDSKSDQYYYLSQQPLSSFAVQSWNPASLIESKENTPFTKELQSTLESKIFETGFETGIFLKLIETEISSIGAPLTQRQQQLIDAITNDDQPSVNTILETYTKDTLDCCGLQGISPLLLAGILQHQAIVDLLVKKGFKLFPNQSENYPFELLKMLLTAATKDLFVTRVISLIEFIINHVGDIKNLNKSDMHIICGLMQTSVQYNLPLLNAIKFLEKRGVKIDSLVTVHDADQPAFYDIIPGAEKFGEHSIATWDYVLQQGLDKAFFTEPKRMQGLYLRKLSRRPHALLASLFRLYPNYCRSYLNEVSDEKYENGGALHHAARSGEISTVDFLLEQKAHATTLDYEGNTFLHTLAAHFSQLRCQSPDITRPQLEQYQRKLHRTRAIMQSHSDLLMRLNSHARTPFLEAAFHCQPDFIQLFDTSDTCAAMRTDSQKTALHLTVPVVDFECSNGIHLKHVDLTMTVKALLQFKYLDINAQDNEGNTVLHLFLFLLNYSIDRCGNSISDVNNQQHLLRIVLLLINHPTINLLIKNKKGLRPIDYIAWLTKYQEPLLLVIHKRNPLKSNQLVTERTTRSLKRFYQVPLLHHAIRFNLYGICHLLLQDKQQDINLTTTFDGENDHFTPLLTLCALEPVTDNQNDYLRSSGRNWYPNAVKGNFWMSITEAPHPLNVDQISIARALLEFKELAVYQRTFETRGDSQIADPVLHSSAFDYALLRSDVELFKLIIAHPEFVLGDSAEKLLDKIGQISDRRINESCKNTRELMLRELLKKPRVLGPFISHKYLHLNLTQSKNIVIFREVLIHPLMDLSHEPMPWYLDKQGLDCSYHDYLDVATRLSMKAIWEARVALDHMTIALQTNNTSKAASYLQKVKALDSTSLLLYLKQLSDPVFKDFCSLNSAQISWLIQASLNNTKDPALLKYLASCYENGQGVNQDLLLAEGLYRKAGVTADQVPCRIQSNAAEEQKEIPLAIDQWIKQLTPYTTYSITSWVYPNKAIVNDLIAKLTAAQNIDGNNDTRSLFLNAYTELHCLNEQNKNLLTLLISGIQCPPNRPFELEMSNVNRVKSRVSLISTRETADTAHIKRDDKNGCFIGR